MAVDPDPQPSPELRTGAQPPLRSGTQPPLRSGTQPPLRSGTQPPLRSGTQPVTPAPEAHDDGDSLPADLDVTNYVGQYTFPDIRRRRGPGALYLVLATGCFALWVTHQGGDRVMVNEGFLVVAVALLLVGWYHLAAAWPLAVRDTEALVAAAGAVGFPVGHASAQLGWRGLRSRPTWRILLYSSEDPPARRGIVLVDGVDGEVLAQFTEDNPEDWSKYD